VRNTVAVELAAASLTPASTTRRYAAGKQMKVKRQDANLPRGANSVFALGLEGDAIGP
jgi:hypothetical protein